MKSVRLRNETRGGVLRCSLLVLSYLVLCAAMLCPFTQVQAQPLPDRRPISGRVVTAENKPIKGATVTIRRQSTEGLATFWGSLVATDAKGEFSIPNAEAGSYFIAIKAEGFAPLRDKSYLVDIANEPLSITLERLATLSICVYKPDGSVLRRTSVTAHFWLSQGPLRRRAETYIIDDNGRSTITKLIPGKYIVQILAEGVGVVTLHDVDVRYAEPTKLLDARLRAGGTLRVMTKELQQNQAPRPFGGAVVMFTAASKSDSEAIEAEGGTAWRDDKIYDWQVREKAIDALITRDGDGILEVADITPGIYRVGIYSPSHKQVAARIVEVKVGETISVDFLAEPIAHGTTLEVLVHDLEGAPIADTVYKLWMVVPKNIVNSKTDPQSNLDLLPDTKRIFEGNAFRLARTDKDGKLMFYPVQPGKWVVQLVYPLAMGGSPASQFHTVEITTQGGSVTVPIFRFQPKVSAK